MMKKKLQTQEEHLKNWIENECEKDKVQLEKEKNDFINEIKKLKKEDLISKNKKISIWERIKKTLVG